MNNRDGLPNSSRNRSDRGLAKVDDGAGTPVAGRRSPVAKAARN